MADDGVKARTFYDARGGVMDDHRGSKDGTVAHWTDAQLHAGLAANGHDSNPRAQFVDHNGHLTKEGVAAVRKFQADQGIKIDGIIGRQTFGKLSHPTKGDPARSATHNADTSANSMYDHHFPALKGDHYEGGNVGALHDSLVNIADDIQNGHTNLPDADKLKPTAEALGKELAAHSGQVTLEAARLFEKLGRDSGFKYRGRFVTDTKTLGQGFNQLVLHFSLYHKY
jgi:hypothetical protein